MKMFKLKASAGVFSVEGENVHANQRNLKAAVPACKKYGKCHVQGNFQIYRYGTRQKPAFIYCKQHKKIETDAEYIEFDHWCNATLVEYCNHQDVNE